VKIKARDKQYSIKWEMQSSNIRQIDGLSMVLIAQYMDFPMAKELLIHLNPYSVDIYGFRVAQLALGSVFFQLFVFHSFVFQFIIQFVFQTSDYIFRDD